LHFYVLSFLLLIAKFGGDFAAHSGWKCYGCQNLAQNLSLFSLARRKGGLALI